jgi:apolipoprotein N-acyltransferase
MQKTWLLPVISGVLIGTSYIPFPPWASLFSFVPLWIFWFRQSSYKNIFLGGWLTSFIFTLIGFNWVTYLLHEFAHLPWPVAIIGMILFAAIAHLFVPIAGCLWFFGHKKLPGSERFSLALMALVTILSEFYSLTLFDWNFGYSWYAVGLPVYHLAEIVGFSGLSALTLLANLPLYFAWKNHDKLKGKIVAGAVILIFVVLNLVGNNLKNRLPENDTSVNVLLVQASIANEEKMAAELGQGYRDEIFNRYLKLTDQGINNHQGHLDFAVWPETAFPYLLGNDFQFTAQALALSNFLKHRQLALITGAYSIDRRTRLITNSLFVIDENGKLHSPHYSKTKLLAFGEYIPGESLFPQIRDWLPATGQFARGPGPTMLLNLNGYKIGPQICYESLFPEFSKSLADLGSQFTVNVTNDSWYGAWQEPYQHMYMTLARAVEFRRPLIRATNTGISTVVLASGEILERSPLYKEWSGFYQVPFLKNPPRTFYQQWIWLIPFLLWLSLAGLLALGIIKTHMRAVIDQREQ